MRPRKPVLAVSAATGVVYSTGARVPRLRVAVDAGATYYRPPDYSSMDLRRADFRGESLPRAKFMWSNMREADLRFADLTRADMRGVDLRGADLRGADLTHANLRGADLRGADLSYAIFECTNLHEARLHTANVYKTEFLHARMP